MKGSHRRTKKTEPYHQKSPLSPIYHRCVCCCFLWHGGFHQQNRLDVRDLTGIERGTGGAVDVVEPHSGLLRRRGRRRRPRVDRLGSAGDEAPVVREDIVSAHDAEVRLEGRSRRPGHVLCADDRADGVDLAQAMDAALHMLRRIVVVEAEYIGQSQLQVHEVGVLGAIDGDPDRRRQRLDVMRDGPNRLERKSQQRRDECVVITTVVRFVPHVPGEHARIIGEGRDNPLDVREDDGLKGFGIVDDVGTGALQPLGIVHAGNRFRLRPRLGVRIPAGIQQDQGGFDPMLVCDRKKPVDALDEIGSIFLPENVVQEHADRVEARRGGPRQLAINCDGIVRGILEHFQFIVGGTGDKIRAGVVSHSLLPGGRSFRRPSLGRPHTGGHQAQPTQDNRHKFHDDADGDSDSDADGDADDTLTHTHTHTYTTHTDSVRRTNLRQKQSDLIRFHRIDRHISFLFNVLSL